MLERIPRREPAMRLKTVSAIALLALATACAHGPRKVINPPRASIQQLQVRPDGQWQLTLRLQNFSSVTASFTSMHAKVRIGGQDAGAVDVSPALSIGPESADVVQATLKPALGAKLAVATALAAGQAAPYALDGSITTGEPKGTYPFTFESSLNPAPGLPGVMR
jgi:hypothetical protein